jgi:hypothetical protein
MRKMLKVVGGMQGGAKGKGLRKKMAQLRQFMG